MDVVIAGHSLGAARAAEYAWARLARGLRVDGLYLFGCPRPGNQVIANALSRVATWSICNGRDHVTDVPFDWPLVNESDVPAAAYEMGNARPEPGDPWGFFAWHHIELYAQACRALPPAPPHLSVGLVDAVDAVADLYGQVGQWDWRNFVDGQFWGMRRMPLGTALLIARGTSNPLEWLQDFDAVQGDVTMGASVARVSRGFWAGVGSVLGGLDAAVS